MRFSCSATGRLLACGNCDNQVHLWDPLGRPPAQQADQRGQRQTGEPATAVLRPSRSGLKHENATVFRCTAVSADGRVVVAARGDGALIWYQQQGAQPLQAAGSHLPLGQVQATPGVSGSGIVGDSHTVAAASAAAAGTSQGMAGGLCQALQGMQVEAGAPRPVAAAGSGMGGAVDQRQQKGSRDSSAAASRVPLSFGLVHEGCSGEDSSQMELDEYSDVATSPLGKGIHHTH